MALGPGVVSMIIISFAVTEMESLSIEIILGMLLDPVESLSK